MAGPEKKHEIEEGQGFHNDNAGLELATAGLESASFGLCRGQLCVGEPREESRAGEVVRV